MTERYACVDVKEFPLQALLRLRPELQSKPVAVLDGEPPFEQVCSLNSAARTLGIALGMTRLEMEMFPTALVLPRSHAEEAAARAALLECAGGFSPGWKIRAVTVTLPASLTSPARRRSLAPPMHWVRACSKGYRPYAYEHPLLSVAIFMPPGAWREGTLQANAQAYGWCREEWNALRSRLYHSRFSIFPRNMRKHSPCGESRHSEHWRISRKPN